MTESSMLWLCHCGRRVYAHVEYCPSCGDPKPRVVEKEPKHDTHFSDVTRSGKE